MEELNNRKISTPKIVIMIMKLFVKMEDIFEENDILIYD